MKKIIAGLMTTALIVMIVHAFAQKYEYVGVAKCKLCHKSDARGAQFTKWEKRKHSTAFEVLAQKIAEPVAKQMGVDNPAESPECFTCHAPLYDSAPELKEEGVTCEVCHGPGNEYKSLSIMKDHEKAAANGLIEYKSLEDIKNHCLTCHENAHGLTFDFDACWELVKHYRPDKQ
jgi:hypothetical protein